MTLDNKPQDDFTDEDELKLAAAEAQPGGLLDQVAAQTAPRPEFAAQLEASLLAMGQAMEQEEATAQPVTQSATELKPVARRRRPQPTAKPGLLTRLFGWPGAQFAAVGLGLGVVMVGVLAVMALAPRSMYNLGIAQQSAVQSNTISVSMDSGQLAAAMQPLRTLAVSHAADAPGWRPPLMEWSPDGRSLATAEIITATYRNGVIGNRQPDTTFALKLWDVETGRLFARLTLSSVVSLKWSPDNQILAVGFRTNLVKLLDKSGNLQATLQAPMPADETKLQGDNVRPGLAGWNPNSSGSVRGLAWSPDGHLLATAAWDPYVLDAANPNFRDGVVRLWDPATGKMVRAIRVHNDEEPNAMGWAFDVKWSPDGSMLAASAYDGDVRVWNPQTGDIITGFPSKQPWGSGAWQFAWSPNSRTLALAAGRSVDLWDVKTSTFQRSLPNALPPTPGPTNQPALPGTPEATVTATGASDDYGQVFYIQWSPDGRTLAAPSFRNNFRLWDVLTGKLVQAILPNAATGGPLGVSWAMSPDWRLLAGLSLDGAGNYATRSVTLWDPLTGQQLRTLASDRSADFAWAADGSKLAVSTDKGVVIWGVPPTVAEATSVPAPQPTVAVGKEEAPKVGSLAPDFELPNVRPGKPTVRLSSLRGKPVLLNFWATGCQPCFLQMGDMMTLYYKYSEQIEFVGISMGPGVLMGPSDTPDYVNSYIELNHFDWIFAHDADSSVRNRYQVTGIPSSYLIDKDGIIRAIFVGRADAQNLEQYILNPSAILTPSTSQPPQPIETSVTDLGATPTPASPQPTSEQPPPRIPLADFKALYDDPVKRPLIIDVRAKESYDAGHINGAISFPEADVDLHITELPKDRLIVAYCQ